jgi:hypothetical protein
MLSRSKRWGAWRAFKSIFQPVDVMATQKRNTSMSYGVMVIDMGVHELDDMEDPMSITQVRARVLLLLYCCSVVTAVLCM